MTGLSGNDIYDLAVQRYQQFATDRQRWDTLSMVYRGQHRELYPAEFREGEVAKIAGFIRHSWDMYTRLVGKVADKRVTPLKLTNTERKRAENIEKILFTYDNIWNMRRRMKVWAHYQVGMGAVAVGIMPHLQQKTPMLLVEDPRNALPGAGWDATTVSAIDFNAGAVRNQQAHADVGGGGLQDIIIRKVLTGRQLREMFPGNAGLMQSIPDTSAGFNSYYTVWQFYDRENVTTVTENGLVLSAPTSHGAPWCPWRFITHFTPDQPAGSSDLEQQIGLEIAFMRLLDQKLAINDAVTWPWMKYKGFVEFDPAKREIKLGSPDADAGFLTPTVTPQVDRDMQALADLLRRMNGETEASQGDVQGGPITGRGLAELSKVVTETVQDFFDDNAWHLQFLYTTALMIDSNLWAKETKILAGRGRGETFLSEYKPGKDIGDSFGQISVEFGPGLGGFEGHLQMLQDLGAESIAIDTVMEKNPNIPSVSEEKRKIQLKKIDALLFDQALQGQLAVPIDWLVRLRAAISNGDDWQDWIQKNPPGQQTATPDMVPPVAPGALPPGAGEEPFQPPVGLHKAPRMTASPNPPGGAPPPLAALLGG